jgi:hypothetical protein
VKTAEFVPLSKSTKSLPAARAGFFPLSAGHAGKILFSALRIRRHNRGEGLLLPHCTNMA